VYRIEEPETMRRRLVLPALGLACAAAAPLSAHAQRPTGPPAAASDTAGAFPDAGTAALMHRARDARRDMEGSLRSYTAIARSRVMAGLRMPLKDRTLFRSEGAARIRWSRDGDNLVQVLAGRSQSPGGVSPDPDGIGIMPFDPRQDRLYFGMMRDSVHDGRRGRAGDDDDFYIEHPLGQYAERHYRYQAGDTVVIRLQDGRALRVAELLVMPRRNDPQTVRGTLWIETSTGAVVRAAFRLARKVDIMHDLSAIDDDDMATVARVPFIHPMEFDLSLMTIEYSLWDMTHWLPRTMRLDGMARAGIFVVPASFDVSYQMLDVITDRDPVAATEAELIAQTLAEWRAEGDYVVRNRGGGDSHARMLTPRNPDLLLESELLPPPIWEDAPGFLQESELREIHDRIAAVAGPRRPDLPVRLGWGLTEPGTLRYNRVEALSIGARLTVPLPHVTVEAVGRIGAGDLHPNAELLLRRETLRRTLELRGYHQLTTADESRRALGPGNSLSALLLGRDEGEYFRATGASLTLAPPAFRRRSWEVRLYAEAHDDVGRGTHIALPRLWHDSVFRPNIAAWETTQLGAALHFRPWWGLDPFGPQFGIDALLQGELTELPADGRAGWSLQPDAHVLRGRVTLRGALPLPGRLRAGAEAGIGVARGATSHAELSSVPPQRLFYLGGASTLRGYEPGTLRGPEMARGRLELARTLSFGNVAVFGDYARTSMRHQWTSELWAAGAGLSLIDGLVRVDLARGVGPRRGWQAQAARQGWRLDLHLDAVL
jgi:hypothetical protein